MGISSTPELKMEEIERAEGERKQTVAEREQSGALALQEILHGVDVRGGIPAGGRGVSLVVNDSRKAQPGALFVAVHGVATDGNLYAKAAAEKGATAVISETPAPADWNREIPWIEVRDARKALAITSANFYRQPAKALKLIGVTGTNGKTTTTSLIDSIVKASGAKTGLFGTIAYHTPAGEHPAPNTTPESVDLQSFLAETRDAGGAYATMEASSHALAMDRLWGCHFAVAVFTNLTRDHIDYH
jgi:UDP-N-acetylmuramoyl-L-alanyl-D-glutamate--2,6-diaminopimelate ligase